MASDAEITGFVNAVVKGESDVGARRAALRSALGDAGLVDVCGVLAQFTMMVRIADACGIPLDDELELATVTMREEMGVERFGGARETAPWRAAVGRVLSPVVPRVMRLQGAVMSRLRALSRR